VKPREDVARKNHAWAESVIRVPGDSTSRLARGLADQRAIVQRAVAVSLFLGACALWRLSPIHEPEPFTSIAILISILTLGLVAAFGLTIHDAVTRCVDDLILLGYSGDSRRTPIERAVSARLSTIESVQSRRRLAQHLRWRLRLVNGTALPSPGYTRASITPPLGFSQRYVLRDEQHLVTKLANRIEQAPVDPRALIILWTIITTPPPVEAASPGHAAELLRQRIHAADILASTCEADTADGSRSVGPGTDTTPGRLGRN
jgi:hypothetical protein